MDIILDTNFLIYCAKEKIDYEDAIRDLINENYILVVPEQVITELKKLTTKAEKGKDRTAADLALQILTKKNIKKIIPEGKNTDHAILNHSRKNRKNIVATLDREMRQTLPRVILMSKGKKLLLTR